MAIFAALALLGSALAAVGFIHTDLAAMIWMQVPVAAFAAWVLHRTARRTPGPLRSGYTLTLVAVGFSLVLVAALLHDPDEYGPDLRKTMTMVHRFDLVLAAACLVVAALRHFESRFALPATAALSPTLIFVLPLGTIAAIWWMVRVRGSEATARACAA